MPERICKYFYELAILLSLLVIVLLPFHAIATRHYFIAATEASPVFELAADENSGLCRGDSVPIYRFWGGSKLALGHARVIDPVPGKVLCSYRPGEFRYPLGRHGRITGQDLSGLRINLGTEQGFKTGDRLCLFKETRLVGRVRLTEVFKNESFAEDLESGDLNDENFFASEFTVITQAAVFKNPLLSCFEILLFLLVIGLHSRFFIGRPRSLLFELSLRIQSSLKKIPPEIRVPSRELILCVSFVWFFFTFSTLATGHIFNTLHRIWNIIPASPSFSPDAFYRWPMTAIYLAGIGIYLRYFLKEKRSLALEIWRWSGFSFLGKIKFKGTQRDRILWALHLLIAYAFAKSLFSFLGGNIRAMLALSKSGLFSPAGPDPVEGLFMFARYFLWSVTIVGCLAGYGHTLLGFLWGKKIRNLDFTVAGWFTNALCYGPLLGFLLWQMVPPLTGPKPVLTGGALYFIGLALEFVLNLLYTLSIWNLGLFFGVMTDKGVRKSGFYGVVRHPSYTLEALMFVILSLKGLSGIPQGFSAGMFILIYYLRSEREDQFMSESNPEYLAYKKQTPFKFIPGLY